MMRSDLKPGTRLKSAVDATEVVVVRAPTTAVEVSCGGHPMIAVDNTEPAATSQPESGWATGTLIGKRYGNAELGLEVLCTRAGVGSLGVDGERLEAAQAKPLPASD
jgi:hypothetical protein